MDFFEIYTPVLIGGGYDEWNSKKSTIKKTENVKNANQSWFEEVCNLKYLKITLEFYLELILLFL